MRLGASSGRLWQPHASSPVLLQAKPSRLHCSHCDETYTLPQNGTIKLYKELRCPLDDFELVLWSSGSRGKSYPLCPYCSNHPPFRDMKKGECHVPGLPPETGCHPCQPPLTTCWPPGSLPGSSVLAGAGMGHAGATRHCSPASRPPSVQVIVRWAAVGSSLGIWAVGCSAPSRSRGSERMQGSPPGQPPPLPFVLLVVTGERRACPGGDENTRLGV